MLRDHPALGPCLIQSLYGVAVGHLATDFDRETFAALVDEFDAERAAGCGSLLAAIATATASATCPYRRGTDDAIDEARALAPNGAARHGDGVGAAVGLPILEAMLDTNGEALAAGHAAAQALRRVLLGQW